ncbi:hypothetical protein T4B_14081 [Trichinella pseudospiralis]|uniref:Uncharacterized protein n=1 Tax=Trichinella pseudospiralis TaxID=6337 RepID=A0A0V1J4W6_TRIPS|nr:hypothetical protein T4B_14081 [Trichinella pseudospiralis]KRZ41945.1 hypothetical protein T4C_10599 [Trichinella pseudospiralis]
MHRADRLHRMSTFGRLAGQHYTVCTIEYCIGNVARVGLALSTIDSNICVAHIAGLPARRHLAMIAFCATNTCSAGISIPRSPRAIITPSASSIIESTLSMPWRFSILATILIPLPSSPSACLI